MQSVLTRSVRATRPEGTSAMPTTATPGQNVVDVLKGKGSQCDPSRDVQIGVDVSVALGSQPSAMKPPRQRSADLTRLSGSRGSRRRQRTADHTAEAAGGDAIVKASATGPRGAALWPMTGGSVVPAMPPDGCAGDAGGRTWVPQGFARAIPTNVATSSATTTLALGPLGSAGTSLPGSGDGSITADQRRRWNTVAGACLRVNRARPGGTAPSGRSREAKASTGRSGACRARASRGARSP